MKNFLSRKRNRKNRLTDILTIIFCIFCTFTLAACEKQPNLLDYVSEHRNNLFVYECESFSVKAQNVEREHPYIADGYKSELTNRMEIFITPPKDTTSCFILFFAGGMEHKGEASYDNVKRQFYYSCAANISTADSLPLRLTFNNSEHEITLASIKTDDILPLKTLLSTLFEQEKELLKTLTNGKEFAGELYVRILYENVPYFYVGVVDRKGNVTAFLLDGKTGKILAKRSG